MFRETLCRRRAERRTNCGGRRPADAHEDELVDHETGHEHVRPGREREAQTDWPIDRPVDSLATPARQAATKPQIERRGCVLCVPCRAAQSLAAFPGPVHTTVAPVPVLTTVRAPPKQIRVVAVVHSQERATHTSATFSTDARSALLGLCMSSVQHPAYASPVAAPLLHNYPA